MVRERERERERNKFRLLITIVLAVHKGRIGQPTKGKGGPTIGLYIGPYKGPSIGAYRAL